MGSRFHLKIFDLICNMIEIYTDGACSGNPGPGGYAVIWRLGSKTKSMSEGYRNTTNNRMELMAVIAGLEGLKRNDMRVTVYTDSQYVCNAINKGWLFDWVKKRFKDKKNPDLWIRFLGLYDKFDLRMVWVKGHAGHPENEECDRLAVAAIQKKPLLIDSGFEML